MYDFLHELLNYVRPKILLNKINARKTSKLGGDMAQQSASLSQKKLGNNGQKMRKSRIRIVWSCQLFLIYLLCSKHIA